MHGMLIDMVPTPLRLLGKVALYSSVFLSVIGLILILVVVQQLPQLQIETLSATVSVPPPPLSTDTWGIFNPETGAVVTGNNLETKKPIASITKLFTAEAVLQSSKKDELFSVTFADINTEGRAGKLVYGEQVTPYTLLFPLLIESSNDAGEAIRRHLGNGYRDSITNIQESLTLQNTEIYDASGLSPQNQSSVKDLSIFYTYLRKNNPHILDITRLNTYIYDDRGYVNNNPAHTLATFTGGKNGFIPEAGRTFLGTFTLPNTGDEVGVVLLGSNDILVDIQALLAYAESF